jgi:SRSO17 transposase
MGLGSELEHADRFAAYVNEVTKVIGHADREGPFRDYCAGLLATAGRRSVEPMAAVTAPGHVSMQHQKLLHVVAESPWSDERVLAKVREQVVPSMTQRGPIEAWIIDDTGFPKKGTHSVGVHHQYCGQLGKQANCQVAVTLSIANHHASLPIAYRLYLPREWSDDPIRRKKAHVPASITFKTKPQIALEQIRAALLAGVAPGVVLMDAGYGNNSMLRQALTGLGLTYVAAITSTVKVRPVREDDPKPPRVSVEEIGAQPAQARLAHRCVAGRHQREAAVALCPCAGARCADPGRSTFCRRDAAHRMAQGRGQAHEILACNRRPGHAAPPPCRSRQDALAHRARLRRPQAGNRPRAL